MCKRFRIVLAACLFFALCSPVFASELQVTVNEGDHTIKIFNGFAVNLYVSDLKSGTTNVPVNTMVAAGQEASVSLRGPAPAGLDFARCKGNLPGYAPESDGYLHLPVFFK